MPSIIGPSCPIPAEAIFEVCACHIFNNWQALSIIRTNLDLPPNEVQEDLQTFLSHTLEFLKSEGFAVTCDRLSENFNNFIETVFDVELEDNSAKLVAATIVALFQDIVGNVAVKMNENPSTPLNIEPLLNPLLFQLPSSTGKNNIIAPQSQSQGNEEFEDVDEDYMSEEYEGMEEGEEEEEMEEEIVENEHIHDGNCCNQELNNIPSQQKNQPFIHLLNQSIMLDQESWNKLTEVVEHNYLLMDKEKSFNIPVFSNLKSLGFNSILQNIELQIQERQKALQPVIDDDGFELVQTKGRRR